MSKIEAIRRGYLNEKFLFFHLKDRKYTEFQPHFHDFNKIIIFISGKVVYRIEGKAYTLNPWDILLINSSQIHKPTIYNDEEYERIVLWINSSFLESYSTNTDSLFSCFNKAKDDKFNLLRLDNTSLKLIKNLVFSLDASWNDYSFCRDILCDSIFLQLMVYINRLFLKEEYSYKTNVEYDKTLQTLIEYINSNLDKNLVIENLAEFLFVSKYHLMRKFKKYTGYTIHNYILQKRLIKARSLLMQGINLNQICTLCGFESYSNFIRYFKKQYGLPPKKYIKLIKE